MKCVAILVLLLGFTAPVYAGEVDGKGLICRLWHDNNPETAKTVENVFFFTNDSVGETYVHGGDLKVAGDNWRPYDTSSSHIWWGNLDEWTYHSLDRRSLVLSSVIRHDNGIRETLYTLLCEVTDWAGIQKHFQPEIDELKERMKDNKI